MTEPIPVEGVQTPDSPNFQVGETVTFAEDPNPFTVEAVSASGRWVAATRGWCQWDIDDAYASGVAEEFDEDMHGGWPALGDCVYTVIDVEQQMRGVDNAIGSLGYETRGDCERAVELFESGQFKYSRRSRPIPLNVAEVSRG